MFNPTKMDRVVLALLGALILFLIAMCTSLGDKTVDMALRHKCKEFCDIRNHDVKLTQEDVCICK